MKELLERIRGWIESAIGPLEWGGVWVALAASVVATVVLVILIRIARMLRDRLQERLRSWQGTRIRALLFQRQEILSAEEITRILVGVVRVTHLFSLLLLLSLWINVVFSLFPWTRGLTERLLEVVKVAVITVALALWNYLPDLLLVVVIAVLTFYVIRLARLVFNGIERGRITLPGFYREWASPTFNLVRLLIVVCALVVVFPYLPGSGSAAFQGVSIFVGVLLSLGSTAAVANVVAGIVITYMRAFRIGDRVKIADTVGEVVEKSMFVTRVRTPKNVEISVPNSMVLANHIINYSKLARRNGLILSTTVTIGYEVDREAVEKFLLDAARGTEHVDSTPEPFVLIEGLGDHAVTYELNAATREPQRMPTIYSELHGNILDRFCEAGVEIMSPSFTAVRDGNRAAIPDRHLPSDYQPPAFRLHPLEKLLGGTDTGRSD